MSLGDTVITVIVFLGAIVVIFVGPLIFTAEMNDNNAQSLVQAAVSDFVDDVRTKGEITDENYNRFRQALNSTGNYYDVDMEIKHLDENPGNKVTWTNKDKAGENLYYSEEKPSIEQKLEKDGKVPLKQGDIFYVTVKSASQTMAQILTQSDSTKIVASDSGIVMSNGK